MELEWEDKTNTSFGYLWCHVCQKPKESGIVIMAKDRRMVPWFRMCLECLDKLNSFANYYAVKHDNDSH